MKCLAFLLSLLLVADAYVQKPKSVIKPLADLQKTATGAVAAAAIASSVFAWAPPPADASPFAFSSQVVIAEKVVREGVYGEYEVDVPVQKYDDARSTFKSAKETKTKKGKYTALLAILIVGSFIIPMAQYFWYVRDDDSSENFFAKNVPEPEEPPKKKKWF